VKGLERSTFDITSCETEEYNCIAWAAYDTERWWWPAGGFWPAGAPEEEKTDAFERAYETVGFVKCEDSQLEAGFEKVAIYELKGVPTHAARQLASGRWTSKLGALEDVEHPLDGLVVDDYGAPVRFMKRRRPSDV
jgi:hypothetical protein